MIIIQSLEVPKLTRELYVFTRKICVSARVGKSITKCLNCLSLAIKLFIKNSMARCSRLVIFYFKEKFFVSHASAIHL